MKKTKIISLLLMITLLINLPVLAVSSTQNSRFFDTSMVEEVRAAEEKIKIFESGETKDGILIFDSIEELEGMEIHQTGAYLYQRITHVTCVNIPGFKGIVWKDVYKIENVYSCETCNDLIIVRIGTEHRACGHH